MALWGDMFERKAQPDSQFAEPASGSTIARIVGNTGASITQSTDDISRYITQYERVGIVWRCVDAIATACADVPLQVRDQQGEKGRVLEDDPLNLLLNGRPNTYETAFQFRYRLSTTLLLSRKGAFIEVVRSMTGRVLELHLIPNEQVTVVGDPRKYVRGYWVDGANGRSWLDASRVVWVRTKPHPTDVYAQMTPLVSAQLAADTDYLARTFNRNFLANDGRPGMVVAVRGRLSPTDVQKLQARYGGGPSRAGETTVIAADDISLADMAGTPRDAQWMEAVAGSKDDIMLAYGTPETALGNASGRTFDNADAELEVWWQGTNAKHLNAISNGFDVLTAGGYRDNAVVVPDWDQIDVMQRVKRRRHDKLMEEWEKGLITIDEYREGTGRTTLKTPGSRIILTAANQVALSGSDGDLAVIAGLPVLGAGAGAAADPGTEAAQGAAQGVQKGLAVADRGNRNESAARALRLIASGGRAVKARTREIEAKADKEPHRGRKPKCAYGNEWATVRVKHSEGRAVIDACEGHVERAKQDAAKSVPGGRPDPSNIDSVKEIKSVLQVKSVRRPSGHTRAETELQALITSSVERYGRQVLARFNDPGTRKATRYGEGASARELPFDKIVARESAMRTYRADLGEAVRRIANRTVRELSTKHGNREDPRTMMVEFERVVMGPLMEQAGESFGRIADAVHDRMRETDVEGATKADMERTIRAVVDGKAEKWPATAARFVAGTTVEGAQDSYARIDEDADLVKVWHSLDDDRVRPDHWAVDGETVGIDEKFRVGTHLMSHPHDPTAPIEQTAGCRCYTSLRPRRERDVVGTSPRNRR